MRRIAAALAIALLAGCSSSPAAKPDPGAKPDTAPTETVAATESLPDVTLDGLVDEKPLAVADLTGTPTVINLWASWCGPCKKELPILAKAHTSYGDRVRILGVDFADESPAAAISLAGSAGVTYPLYVDPKSKLKNDLRVIGLPQTVFVDGQGTIVATERRAFRTQADLSAAILKHLGVKP